MKDELLEKLTSELHNFALDHGEPKSGLSKDCESCQDEAIRIMVIIAEYSGAFRLPAEEDLLTFTRRRAFDA